MIYYLTNEYKEKWSIFWREFLAILLNVLIVILGIVMMSSYSSLLIMLGAIIVVAVMFVLSIIILRVQYNIILKKYVDNFHVGFVQLVKPTLALITFSLILLVLFLLLVGISCISIVLVFVMVIVGLLAISILVNTFKYALIENYINGDFTYRGAFKTFKRLLPEAWKTSFIVVVKLFLFALIITLIKLIVKGLLMGVGVGILYYTGSIVGFIAIMLVIAILSIFVGFIVMTLPIQYVISQYFNKIASSDNIENSSSNTGNNSNPKYVDAEPETNNGTVFDA